MKNCVVCINKKYLYPLIFVIFILFAIILRWWQIGSKSYWLDENYSLLRASPDTWNEVIQEVAFNDAHPPLYYLCLHEWVKLGGDSEGWTRSISALAGLGTILSTIAIANLFWGYSASFLMLIVTVFSSFLIYHSQEARGYNLVIFLSMLSHYGFALALIKGKHSGWWLYISSSILGLYTFYYFMFVILSHTLLTLTLVILKEFPPKKLAYLILAQGAVSLAFLPWAILVIIPLKLTLLNGSLPAAKSIIPGIGKINDALTEILFGPVFKPEPVIFLSILGIFMFFVIVYGWKRAKSATIFCTFIWLVPLICVIFFPFKGHTFETRHLVVITPSIFLSLCVLSLDKSKVLWISVIALFTPNLWALSDYYSQTYQKEDWHRAARYIYEHQKNGDGVCFNPFYLQVPFAYYYKQISAAQKKVLVLHLSYDSQGGEVPLPEHYYKYLWCSEDEIRKSKDNRIWIVEVHGSSVAPPEPRMHLWCRKIFFLHETYTFPGRIGTIVVTRYEKRI